MAECSGLIETQLDASYNTTMSVCNNSFGSYHLIYKEYNSS